MKICWGQRDWCTISPIKVKGLINLSITLGMGDNVVTNEAEFLIVDQSSTYNAIIDWQLMKKTSMVTAVYCLTIKFPTPIGVEYVKANSTTAQQCHIQSLQIGKEIVREPTKTSVEPVVGGDVLAIE